METNRLSRNNYYPYYIQIKQILLDRINNGVYEHGQKLPSESSLAKEFAVTRVTLRRALELLRQEGILNPIKGVGWTVIHHRIEQRLTSSYWFGLEVGDTGTSTSSRIIKTNSIEIPKELEYYFNDNISKLIVYELVRLRLYGQYPISLEYSYIPKHLAPEIDKEFHRNESLVWLLENTYGLAIGKSTEYLIPQLSDAYESELLQISLNSPVFQTIRITYSKKQEIIEVRKSIIRGDKVVFRKDFL